MRIAALTSRAPFVCASGLRYEPIFEYARATASATAFSVVADAYVTDDSGTGIVHQAPAFGEDDFRVCLAAGVLTPGQQPFDPTDANGRFTADAPEFLGRGVKEADKDITAAIKEKGRLVENACLVHRRAAACVSRGCLRAGAWVCWGVRVR
jgi:isoleucyl-tRNA synthetase